MGCAAVFAVLGFLAGRAIGPLGIYYSSTAVLYWNPAIGPSAVTPVPSLNQAVATIGSTAFIGATLNGPGQPTVNLTPAEVAARVAVASQPSSSLVIISCLDHDGRRAAVITNALAGAAMTLNPGGAILERGSVAPPPTRQPWQAVIGLLFGAAVGLAVPWVWRRRGGPLDPRTWIRPDRPSGL